MTEAGPIGGTFRSADDRDVVVSIPGALAFEAMRDAMGDPVWLVGATWQILTTNEFKRGRFDDALGAWMLRQPVDRVIEVLGGTGVSVSVVDGGPHPA